MRNPFFILLLMSTIMSSAQTIAKFEIDLSREANGIDIPVTIDLSRFHIPASTKFSLTKVINKKMSILTPFQLDKEKNTFSFIIIRDKKNAEKNLQYELVKESPSKLSKVQINAEDKDGSLTIQSGKKDLLRYVYKTVYPPAGIDSAFRRSGFIHPLWAPHGQELTRIQPPDHYHHYGIWNPWTHVLFEGDTVDFWNIGGKKATVRFSKFISKTDGPVYAEFKALHEHVVFKKDGGERIALNEIQTVRVYKPEESSDYFIVDFTSEMKCATESPFHIVAYRYAGFGWRATEFWDKDNSEMLTSEGKTRDNTDGTKARWCIVYGALPGNDEGGAVMLSSPENYNHPEPLRIWDKKANGGRGDVFANFAPTKDMDWILEPGKTYTLKYRLVVFNGKFDAAKAESAWQYFAKPAEVKVEKK
jgi:Methane oxygenase PmoA